MPEAAQRGWTSLTKPAKAPNSVAEAKDAVDKAIRRATDLTNEVRSSTLALHGQKLSRLFEGGTPFGVFFATWVVAAVPTAIALGWTNWLWIAISFGIAAVVSGAALAWLWPVARGQSGRQYQQIQQLLTDARQALKMSLQAARERGERESEALIAERNKHLTTADAKLKALIGERERQTESEIGRAGQTFPQRLAQLRSELDQSLEQAKRTQADALTLAIENRDKRELLNRKNHETRLRDLRDEHDRDWEALSERWRAGLAELDEQREQMVAECRRLFPDWENTEFESWATPTEAAPAIQFGTVTLDLSKVKNGVSHDARLRPPSMSLQLPAMMTLEEHPAMLITAEEEGRRDAVEVLQLMMLRMLTAMPPGKVRFTILDPVGLGENFASFMHLADFDEHLIASRIWTDARQIDEQLTRLTAHMETVLQKYLRNEFATIHEYNAQAGEVAEPFQILVVANFPTNFSEAAARKLVSIATSGPRCGVYTLIMVDRKQKMPANFDLKDLEAGAVHLDWVAGVERQRAPSFDEELPAGGSPAARPQPHGEAAGFRWRYPAFEHLQLSLDRPPSADRFNDVVRAAGRAAKDSMKVEVPFEQVAPPESEYWTGDTGKELVVPIGRAGARRLQSVRLGKGTSQHLLVAGKTGSGKSTFLHGLITNTALDLQPGTGRVLPDRLQEGRRVQNVRDAPLAARAGYRHRKRAGVRAERAGTARWRTAPAWRVVPRGRRAGPAGFP